MKALNRLSNLWRSRRRSEQLLVTLSASSWRELLGELRRRGQGCRESGAFLLAKPGSRKVSEIVYYDDLDPDCLIGSIHVHQSAFSKLSDFCEERRLRVLADIHTHPGFGVGQSSTDQENPMVTMMGHVGLIVPNFAQGAAEPKNVGVHVYLGAQGWQSYFGAEAEKRVRVGKR